MTKPWLRLYRREEGSFAQLPLYVRALAGEILKLTDDDGVIRIGRKVPWEAIAFALGATQGERRMLRRDVATLLEDGFLVHEGELLRAPNFPRFQGDEDAGRGRRDPEASAARPVNETSASERRLAHEPSTTHARVENESRTSRERVVHENATKSAESQNTGSRIREEKKREEKRRAPSAPARGPFGPPSQAPRRPSTEALTAFEAVESTFSEMRQAAGGGAFEAGHYGKDHPRVQELAEWCERRGKPWHEDRAAFLAPLRQALGAFFADAKAGAEGWPLAWFADREKFYAIGAKVAPAGPDAALAAKQQAAVDRCERAKSEGRFDDAAEAKREADAIAAERRKLRGKGAVHA